MLTQNTVSEQKNQTQKSLKLDDEQPNNSLIQNYYGAHKTYKTDFRNKKFKHVYNQLIHRRPAQKIHEDLYYEDLLVSIIKTIEWSFYTKQNFIENIEPFYHFGKKTIKQFYLLFLIEKRMIDEFVEIEKKRVKKISMLLALIIEFSGKMAFFLKEERDYANAERILKTCYQEFIKKIIKSSTSNIRLLKKCSEFCLIYACFLMQTNQYDKILEILEDSLTILMNLMILVEYLLEKSQCKKKPTKKYIKILQLLVKTLLMMAFYAEIKGNLCLSYEVLQDSVGYEKVIKSVWPKYSSLTSGLYHLYANQYKVKVELSKLLRQQFDVQELKRLSIPKIKPYYPYKFQINQPQTPIPKKQQPSTKNPYFFNNFFVKKQQQKTQKQVRFKITNSQVINKQKPISMELTQSETEEINSIKIRSCINSTPDSKVENKKKMLGVSIKSIEKAKNNEDVQKFWSVEDFRSSIKPKRTFSIEENPNSVKIEEVIRNSRRKLSENKINPNKQAIIQVNPINIIPKLANNGLRQNQLIVRGIKGTKNMKKKSAKFCDINFKKKKFGQNYTKYKEVKENIQKWHQQAISLQAELNTRIKKLKQKQVNSIIKQDTEYSILDQKSNTNNQNFCKISQKIPFTELSSPKKLVQPIQKTKNIKGINLLRHIFLQHKKFFKIINPELFALKNQNNSFELVKLNMSRKSLLPSDSPEMNAGEKLNKNHEKANKNIEFFLKEYEISMNPTKKGARVLNLGKKKENIVQALAKEPVFREQGIKKARNSQLFITSLKPNMFLETS